MRPFRLMQGKKELRWHCYAFAWTARDGAWKASQWLKVGEAIEVFNLDTGEHIATIARKARGDWYRWVNPKWNTKEAR